jgi:tetratricopeptide (TPR) repeat protein
VWSVDSGLPAIEPLRHRGWPIRASLSPDNRWLAAGESAGGAYIWEMPPLDPPPPSWLAEFAESVACERVTKVGFEAVPPATVLDIGKRFAIHSETNPWGRFLSWFLADRQARPISPSSTVVSRQIVDRLVDEGSFDCLRDANRLSPDRGDIRLDLARLAVMDEHSVPKNPGAEIDYFRRWILDSPEARWARASSGFSTNVAEALDEMRRAASLHSHDCGRFYRMEGIVAMRASHWEDAFTAFDKAIPLTPKSDGVRWSAACLGRRNALLQLGRREQAAADPPFPLKIPPRDANAGPRQIDLSEFYTAALDEPWHDFTVIGNSLADAPHGTVRLGGDTFDIRGVIQLASVEIDKVVIGYPAAVAGIPVRQTCRRLKFLHSAGWTLPQPRGAVAGWYRFHYTDGGEASSPIVIGENIDDWWLVPEHRGAPPNAPIAWKGSTPRGGPCALFAWNWENPSPEREIASFDFISAHAASAPFLVAVTAE